MTRIKPTYQKAFEVHQFTGKVAEAAKNMETKVSGGGGGGSSYQGSGYTAPVSIRSTTVVHDQLFLIDTEGREKSFQLQGFNLACRAGNDITIYWYIREGASSGPYFGVFNHTTGIDIISESETKVMFLNRAYILLLAIFGVVMMFQSFRFSFFITLGCAFFIWKMLRTAKAERKEFEENLKNR